jgi:hypothetical protein
MKHVNALSSLLFHLASEYVIWNVQDNEEGLECDGIHQVLVYNDDVNLLGKNVNSKKNNT